MNLCGVPVRPLSPALSHGGRGSGDRRRCWPGDWGEQGFDGGLTADRNYHPVPSRGGFAPSPLAGEGWGEGGIYAACLCAPSRPALSHEGRGSEDRRRCRPGDWGEQGFDGGLTADRYHHPAPSRGGFAPSPRPSPTGGEGVKTGAAVSSETGANIVSMGGPTADRYYHPVPSRGGFAPSPLAGEGWGERGIYAACLCAPSPPALSREGRGSEGRGGYGCGDWGRYLEKKWPSAHVHHLFIAIK